MEFSQKSYRRWNTVLLLIIITGLSAADPNCAVTPVNDATSSLVCVGIDNTTLDLLTSQLDTLKASGLLINLELQLSDVNGLPSNFLTGYPIRSLTFFNDGLTDFPDGVLNNVDSPLVVLDLSFNAISDVKYEHFENLQFVPSLEILILSNNKLTALPNKNIFQMFPNLRRLILSFNNIDTLKSNSFADLSALTDLHLYANQIGKIEIDAFGTLPSLTRLYLNENNIDTLDDGTFSLDKFPALIRIYLGNNPFYCNCSLQWFKLWLQNRNLIFESDATCAPPLSEPFALVEFCPENKPMRVLSWDSSLRMLYMNYVKDVILQDPRERKFRMDLKNRAVAMK